MLSEIINTYLKQFAIPNFRAENDIQVTKEINFKRDYRPTLHYKQSLAKLIDNITSYQSSLIFVDETKIANQKTLFNKNLGLFYARCTKYNLLFYLLNIR